MDFNISNKYRHINRYRQIAQVLLKHGLGFIIDWLDLGKYLPFKKRLKKSEKKLDKKNVAIRIRLVLQELGPTFIKLGQVISTRADILPPQYIEEFKKLQDKVPGIDYSKIEEVLKNELGNNFQDIFKNIEKNPKAAASIAQIHKAELNNGQDVILKVQRPGIRKITKTDLEIMTNFAEMLEERNLLPSFIQPQKIVNQFSEAIRKELDFTREIDNINRFKANFSHNSNVIIPDVMRNLSSNKLIVMEEIKGTKINNIENCDIELNRPYLAKLGAKSLFKQILIDGFFHADPHPGNIFIVDTNKIAYVDLGMVGEITREDRDLFAVLFTALIKKEVDIIVDKILEIGNFPSQVNKRKLKLDISDLIHRYHSRKLKDINLGMIFTDLQHIIFKYHIKMPEEFFLLFRALGVSEGVGTTIDPSFNLVEMSDELILELLKDRLQPENIANRLFKKIWRFKQVTSGVPEKLENILNKLEEDEFTIRFAHSNLEPLINKLDIASNRLSISLIISALIIGSTMVLQTDMKPIILGIPVLGFLGYITAGILGVWLVIAILKSGKF